MTATLFLSIGYSMENSFQPGVRKRGRKRISVVSIPLQNSARAA